MIAPGTRIAGRYTVLRSLGAGGMGGVYEIRGDTLDNRLALKVIRPEYTAHASLRERFVREARIQATLQHPSIARVYELVEHDGSIGIVMEFIDAPTLRDRMRHARLDADEVRAITRELAEALLAAHEAGIVHRDLKPGNIFVWPDRLGRVRCKLIDFGIAKRVEADESLTKSGAFVGTVAYASPEQITLDAPVDHRSDLYSLGVLVWEMLAGSPPYRHHTSLYTIQNAVVQDELPDLPPSAPSDLGRLVDALTRKSPSERPQSAEVVLQVLSGDTALLAGPLPTWSPDPPPPPPEPPTTNTLQPKAVDELPEQGPTEVPAARAHATRQLPALHTAPLPQRVVARVMDELGPQLVQFTCVGLVAYPLWVAALGTTDGRSWGRRKNGVRVVNAHGDGPLDAWAMVMRNLWDLAFLQLPLLCVTNWAAWLLFPLPLVAGLWVAVYAGLELAVAASNPEGRRIADHLFGTRVVRDSGAPVGGSTA